MQPPSGGSHSTGPGMLVITWLFTGISAVVVSLKIWTRYKIIGQTGLEDVFTVLALVCRPPVSSSVNEANLGHARLSSLHSLL